MPNTARSPIKKGCTLTDTSYENFSITSYAGMIRIRFMSRSRSSSSQPPRVTPQFFYSMDYYKHFSEFVKRKPQLTYNFF